MSDDTATPIPEHPGEDPHDSVDWDGRDDHGLSGTLDSGFDVGSEDPAEPSSTVDAADRGDVPGADEGRDG